MSGENISKSLAVVPALTAQACSGGACDRGFWGGPMMGGGWGLGIFGGIISLLFWVAVAVVIVYLVKHLMYGSRHHGGAWGESAEDVLKKRYAKGEITKEQYAEMKKELEKM